MSLRKSKHTFYHTLKLFRKKKRKLSDTTCHQIEQALDLLQHAILKKERDESDKLAKRCEVLARTHLKRGFFEHSVEVVFAFIFALVVATIVRQMWFELYEIPSGSMRPTLKEGDRLLVSKTQFGINVPLMLQHFMFDPGEVKRNGVFIFNGENLNIPKADNYMYYFYLFPGYKQYVKRMMGKPGDILYFYGGQIYGIDKDGKDITPELQPPELDYVKHVPFLSFEGSVKSTSSHSAVLYQMDLPVAKLYQSAFKQVKSEILYSTDESIKPVSKYEDLWGFKNYAMPSIVKKGSGYHLTLIHSPSLANATLHQNQLGNSVPILGTSKSVIPIDEKLMQNIFKRMTTARFVVKDGYARRESQTSPKIERGVAHHYPKLSGVPNGTYEFFNGIGYRIYPQGITKRLASDHPLMTFSFEQTMTLFNMGMDFDTRYLPSSGYHVQPSRYAFFKNGSLYLMNQEVLGSNDAKMKVYVEREKKKASLSNGNYTPFIDFGPPMKDGELDVEFIRKAGFRVPDGHYLALGDNYGKSGDSRWFGCVPQANIKGVPEFIFWPPGSRWGFIKQTAYPIFTPSRLIIWTIAAILFALWYIHRRKKVSLPIKFDK